MANAAAKVAAIFSSKKMDDDFIVDDSGLFNTEFFRSKNLRTETVIRTDKLVAESLPSGVLQITRPKVARPKRASRRSGGKASRVPKGFTHGEYELLGTTHEVAWMKRDRVFEMWFPVNLVRKDSARAKRNRRGNRKLKGPLSSEYLFALFVDMMKQLGLTFTTAGEEVPFVSIPGDNWDEGADRDTLALLASVVTRNLAVSDNDWTTELMTAGAGQLRREVVLDPKKRLPKGAQPPTDVYVGVRVVAPPRFSDEYATSAKEWFSSLLSFHYRRGDVVRGFGQCEVEALRPALFSDKAGKRVGSKYVPPRGAHKRRMVPLVIKGVAYKREEHALGILDDWFGIRVEMDEKARAKHSGCLRGMLCVEVTPEDHEYLVDIVQRLQLADKHFLTFETWAPSKARKSSNHHYHRHNLHDRDDHERASGRSRGFKGMTKRGPPTTHQRGRRGRAGRSRRGK